MTTLAYDGRYIAIDSQVTQGDTKYLSRKTWEVVVDDRTITLFGTGSMPAIHAAVSAMAEGLKMPKGDYTLLAHGFAEGVVEYCGEDAACPVTYDHYAAGSGAQAALGAMKMGASAAKAVEIASTIDVNTGGPVIVFDTRTGKYRTARKGKAVAET